MAGKFIILIFLGIVVMTSYQNCAGAFSAQNSDSSGGLVQISGNGDPASGSGAPGSSGTPNPSASPTPPPISTNPAPPAVQNKQVVLPIRYFAESGIVSLWNWKATSIATTSGADGKNLPMVGQEFVYQSGVVSNYTLLMFDIVLDPAKVGTKPAGANIFIQGEFLNGIVGQRDGYFKVTVVDGELNLDGTLKSDCISIHKQAYIPPTAGGLILSATEDQVVKYCK